MKLRTTNADCHPDNDRKPTADCRPFLTAEWRKLIMANYIIEPDLLKKYLPLKTELDLWNDKCYVSLVGFMFQDVRVKGLRIPFHVNFPEINLRFYVRYKEGDQWK